MAETERKEGDPCAWRYRGPRGGWITVDTELARSFSTEPLVPRSDYLAAVEREHRARQILPKEIRLVCERLRSEASAAEAKVAEQAAEIERLREATFASDYLISALDAVTRSKVVRDLDEAWVHHRTARAAVSDIGIGK